ncbi:hypothetical protein BDN72DRAFT_536481 [Pluteus cervinus]|uniref:Uncharacterized protein n=1 Tax=Pluteus cervinus TaxID=181527 RepID=A0ACD3AYY4_9AGAR|nr:hypothetical protein BDN72DRAFT_536481 [Pluteus cervinus]
MIVFFALMSLLQARAIPIPLGPGTFPITPNTILFGRATPVCLCDGSATADRTLFEIVRSCLLTIAACVYRSIHPNIINPKASLWRRQWLRLKITFYALMTPEMMIWWAMRQWFGAQIVADRVNRTHPELRWTRTHGYFAIMGGFSRKGSKEVLHPPCLVKLLREGKIDVDDLRLTQEDIEDRSKGDVLSKGLVGLQTTWFIFECLARWQQDLPLTELEVVTVAFAVLNVFTYLFWWRKPLNVNRPAYVKVLEEKDVECTCTDTSYLQALANEEDKKKAGIWRALLGGLGKALSAMVEAIADVFRGIQEIWCAISIKSIFRSVVSAVKTPFRDWRWWPRLIRHAFVAVAWPLWNLLQDHEVHHDAMSVSTFYGIKIPDATLLAVHILSSLIGVIFGIIHFLSWNSRFSTHSELLLWRTSSVVLVVQPLILALGGLLLAWGQSKTGGYSEWLGSLKTIEDLTLKKVVTTIMNFKSPKTTLTLLFGALSATLGLIAYIMARFSVLVLAFITLHALPVAVFENVSWTSYIPHL